MSRRTDRSTPEQEARWAARRKTVGARIRELRLAAQLTQEALALEAGMSRNQIVYMEWGSRSVTYERLFDIADALDVGVGELFEPPSQVPQHKAYRGGRAGMRPDADRT